MGVEGSTATEGDKANERKRLQSSLPSLASVLSLCQTGIRPPKTPRCGRRCATRRRCGAGVSPARLARNPAFRTKVRNSISKTSVPSSKVRNSMGKKHRVFAKMHNSTSSSCRRLACPPGQKLRVSHEGAQVEGAKTPRIARRCATPSAKLPCRARRCATHVGCHEAKTPCFLEGAQLAVNLARPTSHERPDGGNAAFPRRRATHAARHEAKTSRSARRCATRRTGKRFPSSGGLCDRLSQNPPKVSRLPTVARLPRFASGNLRARQVPVSGQSTGTGKPNFQRSLPPSGPAACHFGKRPAEPMQLSYNRAKLNKISHKSSMRLSGASLSPVPCSLCPVPYAVFRLSLPLPLDARPF